MADHHFQNLVEEYTAACALGWSVQPFKRGENGAPKPCVTLKRAKENPQQACAIAAACHGLLLNVASIGATVIDFDDADLYERWKAENTALAATCPTVRTGRGFHIYAQLDGPARKIQLKHIDVFKKRGQVAIPPSLTKCGTRKYEWIVPFGALPKVNDIQQLLPADAHAQVSTVITGGLSTQMT